MRTMSFNFSLKYIFSAQKSSGVAALIEFNDRFLLTNSMVSVYTVSNKYCLQLNYVERELWAKNFLLQKICIPNKLAYIVDGVQFSSENELVVQYNCNSMLSDLRVNYYTELSRSSLSLVSVSTIYSSACWLERELSDFTNIFFLNASDTRRLLLDYFQVKQEVSTHINNEKSFSNMFYEVIFNY